MPLFARKPRRQHSLPAGQRVYAIGDIHGRIDLFEALLARIQEDAADHPADRVTVLLLGDLIDRGPHSAAVVDRAMRPLPWAAMRSLKGNHEAAMLEALDGDRKMLGIWLRNGGIPALRSWGIAQEVIDSGTSQEVIDAARAMIPAPVRAWLARCPVSMHLGDYYFVHAGIKPGVKLAEQREEDALWIRETFLDSDRNHGVMVIHGHSVTDEIDERHNRIGIDTGAYASGKLTAVGFEDKKRWILQT